MAKKRNSQNWQLVNQVYAINTCNVCKEYSSFTLIGVYDNRLDLNRVLIELIKNDSIKFSNGSGYTIGDIPDMSLDEIAINIDYVSVQLINLNEDL